MGQALGVFKPVLGGPTSWPREGASGAGRPHLAQPLSFEKEPDVFEGPSPLAPWRMHSSEARW